LNHYEMINIVDVHWEDGDLSQAEKMISGEIVKAGGEVLDIGSMGRRKLSYVISDQSEGLYILSHFSHPPEGITPLRENLKLNSAIIRTMIVRYKVRPEIELGTEELGEEEIEIAEPVFSAVPDEHSFDSSNGGDGGGEDRPPASNNKTSPGENGVHGEVKEV